MAVSPAGEALINTALKYGAAPVARARNRVASAMAAGPRGAQQAQPIAWPVGDGGVKR